MTFETVGVVHVLLTFLTATAAAMMVVMMMMLTTAGVATMPCFLGVTHKYSDKMQIRAQN